MKRVLLLVGLLGATGALWGWALWWPKVPTTLPERLCGTFRIYRLDPVEGQRVPPIGIPPGQAHYYTFRADGTYAISIRVSGGVEMSVREGIAHLDDDDTLTLEVRSLNRRAGTDAVDRFRTSRGQDDGGEFLLLERLPEPAHGATAAMPGYRLYLRPDKLP